MCGFFVAESDSGVDLSTVGCEPVDERGVILDGWVNIVVLVCGGREEDRSEDDR